MKIKKHRKLPNGYGSIVYRADGNRRRPYAIKISRNGRQQVYTHMAIRDLRRAIDLL